MLYWAYGPGFHLGAGRKTNERRDRDGNRNRRAEAEPARARAVGFARKGRRPCPAVDRTEVETRRARRRIYRRPRRAGRQFARLRRSEEHTSELQSLMRISYAVFCLKNKKHKSNSTKP